MSHELGHTAGIDHSSDPDALMWPFVNPGPQPSTLGADDVAAITTLYPLDFDPLPKKDPKPPKPPKMFQEVTIISQLGTILDDGSNTEDNFQVYDINDAGTVAYSAGVFDWETFELGEGAFLGDGTSFEPTVMARTGAPAPGGGIFGAGVWANIGLDAAGNAGFTHTLEPSSFPLGTNAGVYRYEVANGTLDAVVAPDGDPFVGAFTHTDVAPAGELVFAGLTETGHGVYRVDTTGAITPVAVPGQAFPGGVFERAWLPSVNSAGDVAFTGHGPGEEDGVFLRRAGGTIQSIVRAGDPAPGGHTFSSASHPVINERGDVVFLAGLGEPGAGYFFWSKGKVVPVAVTGQAMPGGGTMLAPALFFGSWDLNDKGEVAFSAVLDTDSLGSGEFDTALYKWSNGKLTLIVRSGMSIPNVGTVMKLAPPWFFNTAFSGAELNNNGQVAYQVTTTDFTTFVLRTGPV